jgi:protoporphyrinogen oxidase
MLVRNRLSRIYFDGKFISYPVKANLETALQLGPLRVVRMIMSYGRAWAFPRRPETSLEDFLINRFGQELYETFFRGYTEKVWGVPCSEISADWGAQRIKGLSILSAIWHLLKSLVPKPKGKPGANTTNTSLIESFLYPKYGPGQMWETVGKRVRSAGGEIHMNHKAVELEVSDQDVQSVTVEDMDTGKRMKMAADHVISTMPVVELIDAMGDVVPREVGVVAQALQYRDFVTVGLLYRKLRPTSGAVSDSPINLVPDNWIYIQDDGIQAGRIQIFNNWSPFMVSDKDTVWVGLEYFCKEGDDFWSLDERSKEELASREMETLGLADCDDLLDSVVLRVPKAYPGYYGGYENFSVIREYTDSIKNLFLVGRNGMHKYNNQDHSMLTAHYAAEAIMSGSADKQKIWDVNIDDEYHEE